MSRLSDLIKDLHPADVPSVSFGSLMTRVRERGKDDESVSQVYVVSNTQGMVRAEDYRENTIHSQDTSNYTVIRPGMIAYNPSRLNIGSIAMLKNDEPGLVSPMYVVFSIDQSKVEKEYFELLMKSSYVSSRIDALKEEGARFRFDYTRWDWINVPLPSKTVQQEIVNTLNVFQDLINRLTSELDARKKQYEYYRDELLETGDTVVLSEVTQYSKDRVSAAELNAENYVGVDNLLQNRAGKKLSEHIPKDGYVTGFLCGDVLIGNIRPYLKKIWLADCNGGTNGDALVIRSIDKEKLCPEFLYHALASDTFFNYDTKNSKGAKMPRGDKEAVMRYQFSLPPLEEQKRIVDTLDRFDALCNDISKGLPAEIEARTKQYEYYRDKLLAFKELS